MQSGNIILDQNRYAMKRTPFSFCLAFKIKSSSLLQPLGVGFDNGMETSTLVVDLQNSREICLTKMDDALEDRVHG